jgi:hypothetical protein
MADVISPFNFVRSFTVNGKPQFASYFEKTYPNQRQTNMLRVHAPIKVYGIGKNEIHPDRSASFRLYAILCNRNLDHALKPAKAQPKAPVIWGSSGIRTSRPMLLSSSFCMHGLRATPPDEYQIILKRTLRLVG